MAKVRIVLTSHYVYNDKHLAPGDEIQVDESEVDRFVRSGHQVATKADAKRAGVDESAAATAQP